MLLNSIRGAPTRAPWEVLLDMAGTCDFSSAYP